MCLLMKAVIGSHDGPSLTFLSVKKGVSFGSGGIMLEFTQWLEIP